MAIAMVLVDLDGTHQNPISTKRTAWTLEVYGVQVCHHLLLCSPLTTASNQMKSPVSNIYRPILSTSYHGKDVLPVKRASSLASMLRMERERLLPMAREQPPWTANGI